MRRIEAVIFDWAGTTVDHGSLAPVKAVTETFARHGVAIGEDDARRDMGIFKKDHIRGILAMPHVNHAWRERHGRAPDEREVQMLFEEFQPLQMEILTRHSDVIEGVAAAAGRLRERGIRIGGTTGYTRPMMDALKERAARQGYAPDLSFLTATMRPRGPPPPMDVPAHRDRIRWRKKKKKKKKVTGNEVGLSAADVAALPDAERTRRVLRAHDTLVDAGAHYVVESAGIPGFRR